ncbi:2622_t:CDS:2, partial [Racocetra fulgida]
ELSTYQIAKNESTPVSPESLSFQQLARFRKTSNTEHPQGPKQKYGFGMGHAKKALDLAIRVDKVEEFVSYIERFTRHIDYSRETKHVSIETQHNDQVSVEEKHDSQDKDLNVEVQVTDQDAIALNSEKT